MYMTASTLDDLLRRVYSRLLPSKHLIHPSRGTATELAGVLLQLTNPRARLSRTESKGRVFSGLGELLWYLAGTNSVRFIAYYLPRYRCESDDGRTIHGGYGPRLFRMHGIHDQIANVYQLLRRNPESRRAVIQLFDAADIERKYKEIPCTCTLQFMIRDNRLCLFVNMRSNDAYLGLPHDVFCFTMIQEIMSRALGVELGTYKHAAGSLHLYECHRTQAQQYLDEGWQPTTQPMPPMPTGDPWPLVRKLLRAESVIRRGGAVDFACLAFDPYWADLGRLLQIYSQSRNRNRRAVAKLRREMSSGVYDTYIDRRRGSRALGPRPRGNGESHGRTTDRNCQGGRSDGS
jgi:thymidylate synthase